MTLLGKGTFQGSGDSTEVSGRRLRPTTARNSRPDSSARSSAVSRNSPSGTVPTSSRTQRVVSRLR